MSSRTPLEVSSGQNSNANHIKKFIKETDLSDHHQSRSTTPTSAESTKNLANQGDSPFNFRSNNPNHDLNPISEEFNGPEFELMNSSSPKRNVKDSLYQKKLSYQPNVDFQLDHSFQSNAYSPVQSIPNTFKYKSHPNAKTKSSFGVNPPETHVVEHDESKSSKDTPPIKTSTIRGPIDFNSTPEWMPSELEDKWVAHQEIENDFSSSVRITKKTSDLNQDPLLDDLNLQFNSGNTMIHNQKFESNETPMWKRASKDYEFQKNSQPNFQNIFQSLDSNAKSFQNNIKNNSNNHSLSSTLSTPMATMSNARSLNKNDLQELENILEDDNQQSFRFPKNPESPLKLFGDDYNTYTKEMLNGVLQKINIYKQSNLGTPTPELPILNNDNLDLGPVKMLHPEGFESSNDSKVIEQSDKENLENLPSSNDYDIAKSPVGPSTRPSKLKNFTTQEQYLKNANNVFSNLQKRGFPLKQANTNRINSNSHTTATSTPKNLKVVDMNPDLISQNDYSSFTSEFGEDSSDSNYHQYNTDEHQNNDYTSFDHSSKGEPTNDIPHNYHEKHSSYDSSYTFDEDSDANEKLDASQNYESQSTNNMDVPPTQSPADSALNTGSDNDVNGRLAELEKLVLKFNSTNLIQKLENLEDENARLRQSIQSQSTQAKQDESIISIDNPDFDFTEDDYTRMQNLIKWKRASQLKLQQSQKPPISINRERNSNDQSIIRGRVKPGIELPVAYDNMILDEKNQRWIRNDHIDNHHGSLDSIEDLVSDSEDFDENTMSKPVYNQCQSLKSRLSSNPRRNGSKLEVSFHLPHLEMEKGDEKSPYSDVTQVSQLDDVTFSQTRKKLVSVITDILSMDDNQDAVSWSFVNDISLSGYALDSVKDLNKFLPNLQSVDASNNEIKFLDGLPKHILNVNLSQNNIENITSFHQYHDLQRLDVSHNRLVNLSTFNRNIHLTELNVSNNRLTSINGINNLVNLISLNASQNEIAGELNFRNFELPNLQELNLSENKVQTVLGLENLPSLRVLNLNENKLKTLSCNGKHLHLKKLLVKFNSLQSIRFECFPFLRVLRIDGNRLKDVTEFKYLRYLDEVSCKSQSASSIVNNVLEESRDVKILDLSGNSYNDLTFSYNVRVNPFLNLNKLVLSAMNLSKIPDTFSSLFPNVRELNLNFNKLSTINGLSGFHNIKKLYMVSNNISKTEVIIKGLAGARSTLKVLDLRLNSCNIELYPYVFNPQELDYSNFQRVDDISPIQLETLDDIESFAIHYQSLSKSVEDWTERDTKFIHQLGNESNSKVIQRLNYETLLINFFKNLRRLDGGLINNQKRGMLNRRLNQEGSELGK